jgi:hypothetical protein
MDNKKFEQLIDLIINENEEQARALFHDIVVEKSREIYEDMMDDEMAEGMGGQVGDLIDEIDVEEQGMAEAEDDGDDLDFDSDEDEVIDIEAGEDDMGGEENLEDRVVDLEDKLDQLMAEFEEIMGGDDEEVGDESDAEFDDEAEEAGNDFTQDLEAGNDEDPMMEAITLKKVSVTHGDNGVQTKSPGLTNSGQAGMDSKPVKFSGASESVPTSPKGPSNAYTKGEASVKGAGSFKNSPAQNNADLEKAPAPSKGDNGVNSRSPVAESRNSTKRRV